MLLQTDIIAGLRQPAEQHLALPHHLTLRARQLVHRDDTGRETGHAAAQSVGQRSGQVRAGRIRLNRARVSWSGASQPVYREIWSCQGRPSEEPVLRCCEPKS